ncbi:NAD(P)H-binding protein [Polaromonas sp. P1-6]|nr:NAD(P)H-binding protein [Polaromonas sp. P1-6]
MTSKKQAVTVYGAYGHTGRFVVSELRRRGWTPILSGRDPGKLSAFGAEHSGLELRPASVDEPASLDRALMGAVAVINCAGPFASTSAPLIEAALRARIPYLDVVAEIEANIDTFELFADRAREGGIVVVHAMAFYGGLGDLLATAAMGDWTSADEISIAYGLDSWRPTPGTLVAGQVSKQRRDGRRVVFANGKLSYVTGAAPVVDWTFPCANGKAVGHRRIHHGGHRDDLASPEDARDSFVHDGRSSQGPDRSESAGADGKRRKRSIITNFSG